MCVGPAMESLTSMGCDKNGVRQGMFYTLSLASDTRSPSQEGTDESLDSLTEVRNTSPISGFEANEVKESNEYAENIRHSQRSIKTEGPLSAQKHQSYGETFDLTILLGRCEGDEELLSEVLKITSLKCFSLPPNTVASDTRS